jgi:hypothetical protein
VDDIWIYVDTFGRYMTVRRGGKEGWGEESKGLVSTHGTAEYIIPGPWLDRVMKLLPKAEAKRDARDLRYANDRHKELRDQLI